MALKRIQVVGMDPAQQRRLEQGLFHLRAQWEVVFTQDRTTAMESMTAVPAAAMLVGAQIPPTQVVELVNDIARGFPNTQRFVLFDLADKQFLKHCVGLPPQCLPKESGPEIVEEVLQRAFQLEAWMANEPVKKLVSLMRKSPSMPSLYNKILHELQSPSAGLEDVGLLIRSDPALCAKMLQLVNSAFFGLPRQITSAFEAVMFLGMERVKSLLLYTHFVCLFDTGACPTFSIDRLWHHSMETAGFARWIAQEESGNNKLADEAFTAGLLHDIGKLMLAANMADKYNHVLGVAAQKGLTIGEAEREVFEATHAEVGACLLGVWGLPLSLLEAIAWHHTPEQGSKMAFSALTAVHVANAFAHEKAAASGEKAASQLNAKYLAALGLDQRCDQWRSLCCCPSVPSESSKPEKIQLRDQAKLL